MRFALIDNERAEATSGLKGICPGCLNPVIAKCGSQRVHHWAHSSKKMCDSWWEPETEWHRYWKDNFPNEWQEIFLPDKLTGEKHIADVRTDHGLVIEFQHSHIHPMERDSRERFYKNMVWVVDGTRLTNDYPRFLKEKTHFQPVRKGIFKVRFPKECFPKDWLNSLVPVIFDYRGSETIPDEMDIRNRIYCLFPERLGSEAIIAEMSHNVFINAVISNTWFQKVSSFMSAIKQVSKELQDQIAMQQSERMNIIFEKLSGINRYRRGRRF